MAYSEFRETECVVHEGCGHAPPRKFDSYKEAYRYAVKTSKESHYLGGTVPVQLVVREIRGSVRTFKNGEF